MEYDVRFILASTASYSTVIQFLVPLWICWKYVKSGTTGETSSLPFVCGFLSCSLWLKYGLLMGDTNLIGVNLVGVTLHLLYVATFFAYCTRKMIVIEQFAAACSVLLLITLYASYETEEYVLQNRIGLLACTMTLAFFASPLSQLAHVIRVKSADNLPFPLIVCTFFVCLQWFLYGILIENFYIQFPNALGCLLCASQLLLFLIYPSRLASE